MAKSLTLAIFIITTILAALHQTTVAQELHEGTGTFGPTGSLAASPLSPISPVAASTRAPRTFVVGDGLGWTVPPGGPMFYPGWAVKYIMYVGDTLVFNFINGTDDVAEITDAAYGPCNTTNPIFTLTTSPAKITLTTAGPTFFTSTYPGHCSAGQKFALFVQGSSIAEPPQAHSTTAVFNFVNGATDVVGVLSTSASCDTLTTEAASNPLVHLTTSPAKYTLTTEGGTFFTSTYPGQCSSGQILGFLTQGTSIAVPPQADSPTPGGPISSPSSSAPSPAL
ncbi:hypothetical protein Vadar_028704 [Vaccinium darrowii]|uniref:Uncharacterized protein n=1 Tax=Vaccinium darrowii TaxID=229202 RepID=A0ACB7Y9Z1_9ERIC|nr:hypothetical protein Vadar_028704 [Vaccinium darrowii]